MTRSRTLVLAILVAVAVMLGAPRRARAGTDITTPLLISAGVTGAVLLVYVIAIAGAKDEPDFVYLMPGGGPAFEPERRVGLRFGPACKPTAGVSPVLCW